MKNNCFDNLLKNDEIFINNNHLKCDSMFLCAYSINEDNLYPFIQYALVKNSLNIYTLPIWDMSNITNYTNKPVLQNFYNYFYELSKINDIFIDNYEQNNIKYDGYYEYDKCLYLFFNISKLNITINDINIQTSLRLALIDEIINHRCIFNVPVENNTAQFFIDNNSFIYLLDIQQKPYEIPIVGYVYKETLTKIMYTYIFGENNKTNMAILGPYYYFTDFNNAYEQIQQNNQLFDINKPQNNDKLYDNIKNGCIIDNCSNNTLKYGLVRFALFMGYSKYIENELNDINDSSTIKNERIQDTFLNKHQELLTTRISDHDGIWSKTYDSVYLNKIELDNGDIIANAPLYVIKNYEQQIPLSYHKV